MSWRHLFRTTAAKAAPEPEVAPPSPTPDAPPIEEGSPPPATAAPLAADPEPAPPKPRSPADLARLIERSGDLKGMLVLFGSTPRFERARRAALLPQSPARGSLSEFERIFLLDWFVLQYRLEDGRTVVEHFVDAHPELPEEERQMMLRWPGAIEGVFRAERRDGDALLALNLIDELTYRIYSNQGPATLARFRIGSFIFTRIAPIGDVWTLSGAQQIWSAQEYRSAYGLAAQLAVTRPSLVFRNPKKLEEAWEMQRKDRQEFIAFFGSDTVVLPGSQIRERMEAYIRSRMSGAGDDEERRPSQWAPEVEPEPAPPPFPSLPAEFATMESVGVLYDEVEGLCFFPEFGQVEEAFAHPERVSQAPYREAVLQYLHSPELSPMPVRRLAERYPDGVDVVCRSVLKQRSFSWARDGEALLRRHKPKYYDQPPLPTVTPISDTLSRAYRQAQTPDPAPTGRRPGRNDPCPCGSGKKFKRCCGA